METHSEEEILTADRIGAKIIGVNNRNLKDFTVDINNSIRLRELVDPKTVFVSESGIKGGEDMKALYKNGTDAVLIGELLMRAEDRKEEARRTADGNPERMLKMSEENKDPGIPKARILKSQIQKSQPPGSKIPKTKIKICGLSRMEDIEAVNEACPDYCGFIINYPPSKRNISVDQLAELKKILRKEMKAVGVFVDAPAE